MVEKVDLTGTAAHEKVNDPLCLWGKVRCPEDPSGTGMILISHCGSELAGKQRGQRSHADAVTRPAEKVAAGHRLKMGGGGMRHDKATTGTGRLITPTQKYEAESRVAPRAASGMIPPMKRCLPLAALLILAACDKAEEKPVSSVGKPPRPAPKVKEQAGTEATPVAAAPAPAPKPAAPPAPPAVPATAEEIAAFDQQLEAFRAKAEPFLTAAGAEPAAVTEEEVRSMRESFTGLIKSRAKLMPGLTTEQKKELAQKCMPLIPKVSSALTKHELGKVLKNSRGARPSPETLLPETPVDPSNPQTPRRRVIPAEPDPAQ